VAWLIPMTKHSTDDDWILGLGVPETVEFPIASDQVSILASWLLVRAQFEQDSDHRDRLVEAGSVLQGLLHQEFTALSGIVSKPMPRHGRSSTRSEERDVRSQFRLR
jgi:hypothetical protein